MVIVKQEVKINIQWDDTLLEEVNNFKHFGVTIQNNWNEGTEINQRIEKENKVDWWNNYFKKNRKWIH